MKTILFIKSSPRGTNSYSNKVAETVVAGLISRYPESNLVVRDLVDNPPPHVGRAFVSALAVQPQQRTAEQAGVLALSDTLTDELVAAHTVVIAAPMHNFGLPTTLKAWIDHIARAGKAFRYTPSGPEGLLKGKRAVLVLASGGVYSDGPTKPFDFQEPYLRAVLAFIGITDVQVVRVEGVVAGQIGPEKAVANALNQAQQILENVA